MSDPILETTSFSSSKKGTDSFSSEERGGEKGNILSQYSEKQAMQMGRNCALKHGMDPDLFGRAAALARNPYEFNSMEFLTAEEKEALHLEVTKKWHIPRKLVEVIALGSMAAAVQGMDQSVINGATLFYPNVFGITDMKNYDLMEGLVHLTSVAQLRAGHRTSGTRSWAVNG